MVKLKKSKLYFVCALSYFLLIACLLYRNGRVVEKCDQTTKHTSQKLTATRPGILTECKSFYKDRKEWNTFIEALERYREFHKKKLQEFKSSSNGNGVRTLTWACSQSRCSGLGDQLLRIQYFLLLAMMSDRVFTIYWDEKLKKTVRYLLPNSINWDHFEESKGMCNDNGTCPHHVYDSTSFWEFGWTKEEFSMFGEVLFSSTQHITVTGKVIAYNMYIGNTSILDPGERITEGMKRLGVEQILSHKSNDTVYCGHNPLWYNMLHKLGIHRIMEIPKISSGQVQATSSWLYANHVIFTYLFQFPKELKTKAKKYMKSLDLYNKDYIALHLRTGFMGMSDQEKWITRYLHSGWKFFYSEHQWHCFIRYTVRLRHQKFGKKVPIYLSTDSDLVKDRVKTYYGDENFIFGNFTSIHSRFNHGNCDAESDPVFMWLDFFLLAGAKMIVHPDSSFSVNAAFLKPIPHKFHSWVLYDNQLGCLASYIAGNRSCIC